MRFERFAIATTLGAFAAACTSSTEPAAPADQSPATPSTALPVSWATDVAETSNGAAPNVSTEAACGSATATYLSELLNVTPDQATVQREWGDCVEGGQQVMLSGAVATTHLGPTDLPMSHPYGDDLSMNIDVDEAFRPFAQKLGTEPGEETQNQIHVEISAGFIPHVPRAASPPSGQLFRDAADYNLEPAGFQPGFDQPAIGDRVAIMGRWIIDCGHANFSAELHAMSFLAWAHTEGKKTVVHAYYNPYRDTQLYSPDETVLGKVSDTARLDAPDTKPFPAFFFDEILRVASGQSDVLSSLELIEAETTSPGDWQICPPAGSSGKKPVFHYDAVARAGVAFEPTLDETTGCVAMHSVLQKSYTRVDATLRRCVLPWKYLNDIASVAIGGDPIDLQQMIKDRVTPAAQPRFDPDPEASCADALSGPEVSATPSGQNLKIDDAQPFPFYAVLSVEWAD